MEARIVIRRLEKISGERKRESKIQLRREPVVSRSALRMLRISLRSSRALSVYFASSSRRTNIFSSAGGDLSLCSSFAKNEAVDVLMEP